MAMREIEDTDVEMKENSKRARAELISKLAQVKEAVALTIDVLQAELGPNDFLVKLTQLLKLGSGYLEYLKSHIDEFENTDDIFRQILTLAKSSFTMNIKLYVDSIKKVSNYVNDHPDLYNLNPPGAQDGPWSGIKEFLYHSKNNLHRENFREALTTTINENGASSILKDGDLDHLERFLVDSLNRPPHEFIPEYFEEHQAEILAWTRLSYAEFQQYVLEKIDTKNDLTTDGWLLRLEEELASIKQDVVKSNYTDREKKLRLVRDLRFNRVSYESLSAEVAKHRSEISHDDLAKLSKRFGPVLRKNLSVLMELVTSTQGLESAERSTMVQTALQSHNIPDEIIQDVLAYLSEEL